MRLKQEWLLKHAAVDIKEQEWGQWERDSNGGTVGKRSRNGDSGREEQKWGQLEKGAGIGAVGKRSKSGGSRRKELE